MFLYYGIHFILFFSYGLFFLQFIRALKTNSQIKFFAYLSIIFMFLLLADGIKLILLNHAIAKSGGWLHIKLSIFLIIIIENFYLVYSFFTKKFFSLKFYEILYWINYFLFIIMILLAIFKPF